MQRISLYVGEAFAEALPRFVGELVLREIGFQRLSDGCPVCLGIHVAAPNRDDSAVSRKLAVPVPMVESRYQLAHRQVTGATEDDQVERVDGYKLRHFQESSA